VHKFFSSYFVPALPFAFAHQEFFFQIDSHLHFADDWDVLLKDMYSKLPNKKGGKTNTAGVVAKKLIFSSHLHLSGYRHDASE
jgi:hypothetical protein